MVSYLGQILKYEVRSDILGCLEAILTSKPAFQSFNRNPESLNLKISKNSLKILTNHQKFKFSISLMSAAGPLGLPT